MGLGSIGVVGVRGVWMLLLLLLLLVTEFVGDIVTLVVLEFDCLLLFRDIASLELIRRIFG